MPALQSKNWVFTLNNYTSDELSLLQALGSELCSPVVYLIFAREFGETGTPHLQGYISFSVKKALGYVRNLVSTRGHFERRQGSHQQASDYCRKANPDGQPAKDPAADIFEYGTMPASQQGRRTDLEAVYACVRSGGRFGAVAEQFPGSAIRYGSGIQRLISLHTPVKPPFEIHVFWGTTGTGKTRRVYDFVSADKIWSCPGKCNGTVWFDGYDGHEVALFDDLDGSWFHVTKFLKLIDRYPYRVPVKGGFTHWTPKHIFITSNIPPQDWYRGASENHQNAVMRKLREFGSILECTQANSPYN